MSGTNNNWKTNRLPFEEKKGTGKTNDNASSGRLKGLITYTFLKGYKGVSSVVEQAPPGEIYDRNDVVTTGLASRVEYEKL